MKFIGKLRGRARFHSLLPAGVQSLPDQRGTSVTTDSLPLPITTQGPWLTLGFTLGVHFVGLGRHRMIGVHHHGSVLTSVAALRFLCPKGPFFVWL